MAVLYSLYARQDHLLERFTFWGLILYIDFYRIFGGDYGSYEESQLEETLDQHEELRNRIVEANFKWQQADLLVDYSCRQLAESVREWKALQMIREEHLEERCLKKVILTCSSFFFKGMKQHAGLVTI